MPQEKEDAYRSALAGCHDRWTRPIVSLELRIFLSSVAGIRDGSLAESHRNTDVPGQYRTPNHDHSTYPRVILVDSSQFVLFFPKGAEARSHDTEHRGTCKNQSAF
jgi:hypothetical protein